MVKRLLLVVATMASVGCGSVDAPLAETHADLLTTGPVTVDENGYAQVSEGAQQVVLAACPNYLGATCDVLDGEAIPDNTGAVTRVSVVNGQVVCRVNASGWLEVRLTQSCAQVDRKNDLL